MVIGNVRISKIGLTVNRSNARITATKSAEPKPVMDIPGNKYARNMTTIVVNKSFTIAFILYIKESPIARTGDF